MAKPITKENLITYCEDHLEDTTNAVLSGIITPEKGRGHIRELFFLSATFDLGLQEKAREILKRIDG